MKVKFALFFIWNILFSVCSLDHIPRLTLNQGDGNRLLYSQIQKHTVFFHPEGSDELFVGGTDFVYRFNVDDGLLVENFSLPTTGEQNCEENPCENVITVIQQFQDSLFVCGTNGNKPQCWKLYPQVANQSSEIIESYEGTGISPHVYTQNSISLTIEGDLYAAVPLNSDGTSLQFRRKAGLRPNVWMYDRWMTEPTFISASWVKRDKDPEQEKIYMFFREKNSDSSPEADPWISRVAQVCKVDEGGSKRFFQNMWTSFLKARLVCGIPKESLYFNRLQDIFVQHADDWRDSRVYALFTSSWNSTAVCIYSMADIDSVFENSSFKGFSEEIPKPRPGTCVPNSRALPMATIRVIKDHPEMSDWIHPIHRQAPFYISSNNYTKITVDRVTVANESTHNVLFLATDHGMIHKILEDDFKPFIISETHLTNLSAPVQSMKLDSTKRKLFVGFPEQIAQLDLQRCQDYNRSCEDCILARDPYCAWSQSGCTPVSQGGIQNLAGGKTDVCHKNNDGKKRKKRETPSSSVDPPEAAYSVPLGVPFYLSCLIHSHHASYRWEHNDHTSQCQQTESDCLHLITAMSEDNYGRYRCVSREQDYTMIVKAYELNPIQAPENQKNAVTQVAAQRLVMTVLVPALIAVFYH
ncbi:hypothetical protein MATL_G00095160 [Megalops atlanticus]|uniref:Semaphorin 7A n=1 Tax=Megalops atlanticus TaxID=7932 RepID=A0A9D3Q2P5_MEGAT|nr:hypothetical protein MATL_G00095160 [Megalops atlanticus]